MHGLLGGALCQSCISIGTKRYKKDNPDEKKNVISNSNYPANMSKFPLYQGNHCSGVEGPLCSGIKGRQWNLDDELGVGRPIITAAEGMLHLPDLARLFDTHAGQEFQDASKLNIKLLRKLSTSIQEGKTQSKVTDYMQ